MSKRIFNLTVNFIWALLSALVFAKFGFELEVMIRSIITNLELGVPLNIILQQASMADLGINVAFVICSFRTFCKYASEMHDSILKITMRTKEERDTENFVKWMKKEQKRLRKLERAC